MNNTLMDTMLAESPAAFGHIPPMAFDAPATLTWTAPTRVVFRAHWLREVSGNVIANDAGVGVLTRLTAGLTIRLDGPFRSRTEVDGEQRLRLRLFRAQAGHAGAVRVAADGPATLPGGADALLALLLGIPGRTAQLADALESYPCCLGLPPEVAQPLAEILGEVRCELDHARLPILVEPVMQLRDRIYQAAPRALEIHWSAAVSRLVNAASADDALLDCSFAFSEAGQQLYQRALQGDCSGLAAADPRAAKIMGGLLANAVTENSTLDLHLPYLDKKRWSTRREAFASCEVSAGEDGCLTAQPGLSKDASEHHSHYQTMLVLCGSSQAPECRLGFAIRLGGEREALRAGLTPLLQGYGFPTGPDELLAAAPEKPDLCFTATLPASAAAAWLETPKVRSVAHYDAFGRVSTAIQQALRRWLGCLRFQRADAFADPDSAASLLVYLACRPFSRKGSSEYTYDAINPASVNLALRGARQNLPFELARARQWLLATARNELAAQFAPERAAKVLASVTRRPRRFRALLAAEEFIVSQFIKLGVRCREVKLAREESPRQETRHLHRFAVEFNKNLRGKLRSLLPGEDYAALAPLLLIEATSAIAACAGHPAPIQVTVRLGAPERPEAGEVIASAEVTRGTRD